jgi:hypothetical protein
MTIIETLARWRQPRVPPATAVLTGDARDDPEWLTLQHGRGHSVSAYTKTCAYVMGSIKTSHIAYQIRKAMWPNRPQIPYQPAHDG